jgi:hypothetical protein
MTAASDVAYYSKFPREKVEGWLTFFTTKQNDLWPHLRGFECGPCIGHCSLPCHTSETPNGIGPVNWQAKPCTEIIAKLRRGLGLDAVTSTETTTEDALEGVAI